MKSKRNIFIFLGIISLFLLGFGIKAANSNSDNEQNKIAYSESSSDATESNIKKDSSNKKDKKDKKIADAQTSSEVSNKESKKESKAKKESVSKEENKSSTTESNEIKNEQTGDMEEEKTYLQSEPAPNNSVVGQEEQQREGVSSQITTPAPQVPVPSPPPVEPEEENESVNQPAPPAEAPQETPVEEVPMETVTVSVTSDPSVRGTILGNTAVEYIEGDTALDVSIRIWKQQGIQYGIIGSGSSAYIKGIANLYEFDEGPTSGWHIRVNGSMIDRSAGAYPIGPNDTVNWNYTTNYVEDSEDW